MKHLPNLLTLCGLLCGGAAASVAGWGGWTTPALVLIFLLGAALFDLLDGLAARLLKAQSALGAQLDSLADAVSFGVAPAVLLAGNGFRSDAVHALAAAGLYLACTAWRLARFNVEPNPGAHFVGLASPLAGMLAVSLHLLTAQQHWPIEALSLGYALLAVLMVSRLPCFSLKGLRQGRRFLWWPLLPPLGVFSAVAAVWGAPAGAWAALPAYLGASARLKKML